MTRVVYTIALIAADGTRVTASSTELEFPDTEVSTMQEKADMTVRDLATSHTALMEVLKNSVAIEIPKPARHSRGNGNGTRRAAGAR